MSFALGREKKMSRQMKNFLQLSNNSQSKEHFKNMLQIKKTWLHHLQRNALGFLILKIKENTLIWIKSNFSFLSAFLEWEVIITYIMPIWANVLVFVIIIFQPFCHLDSFVCLLFPVIQAIINWACYLIYGRSLFSFHV